MFFPLCTCKSPSKFITHYNVLSINVKRSRNQNFLPNNSAANTTSATHQQFVWIIFYQRMLQIKQIFEIL